LSGIDYGIICAYVAGILAVGLIRRARRDESAASFIIGGRTLTLPAFVASLVSTWYGGILGIGEFSYLYGISTWLVFGVPYYFAAVLFAIFLAKRARESEVITIPDRLEATYGRTVAGVGSIILFILTVPSAYVLMIGVLAQVLFGWPLWIGVIAGTVLSIIYVYYGGFRSVVSTDLIQFLLMFLGFIVLLVAAVFEYGGPMFLYSNLPVTHFSWHGGNSGWYIAVWYVIALQTLIEPTFYQRCYAARNASTARRGLVLSVVFWLFFDFLTTSCGLYAAAGIPDLANPVSSYPEFAAMILPAGLLGLFMTGLLATVMSTLDSYSFVAASTFGRDIVWRIFRIPDDRITYWTRWGLILSAALAIMASLFLRSVVDIWHHFGSVFTPALLLPLFTSYVGKRRLSPRMTLISILASGGVSLVWLMSGMLSETGAYWLGIEPIFPGLAVSVVLYLSSSESRTA
jgi:SSS family solute:Na+ symporter